MIVLLHGLASLFTRFDSVLLFSVRVNLKDEVYQQNPQTAELKLYISAAFEIIHTVTLAWVFVNFVFRLSLGSPET